MRKIYEVKAGNKTIRVYRDSETKEFVCQVYVSEKHLSKCDYHTDERADAIATADYMVRENN